MTDFIDTKGKRIHLLSTDCVKELHNLLSDNYKVFKDMEPISPSGVKNINMLESAVFRQKTGSGDYYKYDNEFTNCATLIFGVAKNHAFHNGNKRLGLLSMIKHLYVNGYVLNPARGEKELFELLLDTVKDTLERHSRKYYPAYKAEDKGWNDDQKIHYLAYWVQKNSLKKFYYTGNELRIKDFKKILEKYDLEYKEVGVYIQLTKYKERKLFFLSKEPLIRKKYKIGKQKNIIKRIMINRFRKDFLLTRSDGIDNTSFFYEDKFIQDEIFKYKSIIYRLSKT
jgi:prophage maintenance system killer protein